LTVLCASYAAHSEELPKYRPHFGNLEIETCDDYQAMKKYTHIYGELVISGRLMLCDEVFENLDFGNLRYVSGFIYITLNSRLKKMYAKYLRHAYWIVFSGNPMLPTEEADAIGNQVHCGGGVSCIESGHYSEQLGAQ
jgi:hypothetical protein